MTLHERLQLVAKALGIDVARARMQELAEQTADPHLWDDPAKATALTSEQARVAALVKRYDDIAAMVDDDDEATAELVEADLATLEREALLSGAYDRADAIISLYAGAGGTDAADWTQMLLKMYQRYVERAGGEDDAAIIARDGWKAELVDMSSAEEAGIKGATLIVHGAYAYGLLKAEAGVHRLVRQSPFNAKGLRQTSFALVDVIPKIEQDADVAINDKDLRIDVYRSSGKGGQGVNTTDSAVRITHIPTGIVVAIQNERSQLQNKAKAMEILRSRLAVLQEQERASETAAVRGDLAKNEWGSQIRSYVLHPYKMVKDHRTGVETSDVTGVLDGMINPFITAELERLAKEKTK